MTVPPGAIHTFKNASETEACEVYMTATPGHYVDCRPFFLTFNPLSLSTLGLVGFCSSVLGR